MWRGEFHVVGMRLDTGLHIDPKKAAMRLNMMCQMLGMEMPNPEAVTLTFFWISEVFS